MNDAELILKMIKELHLVSKSLLDKSVIEPDKLKAFAFIQQGEGILLATDVLERYFREAVAIMEAKQNEMRLH